MSGKTTQVRFELDAKRDDRWELVASFADEDEARDALARTARRTDVMGMRLRREVHLPGMEQPIVTVLVDTTQQAPVPDTEPGRAAAKLPTLPHLARLRPTPAASPDPHAPVALDRHAAAKRGLVVAVLVAGLLAGAGLALILAN